MSATMLLWINDISRAAREDDTSVQDFIYRAIREHLVIAEGVRRHKIYCEAVEDQDALRIQKTQKDWNNWASRYKSTYEAAVATKWVEQVDREISK